MQPVSSRIWTRVAVSISYDDNDYTTGTCLAEWLVNSEISKFNLSCLSWNKLPTKGEVYLYIRDAYNKFPDFFRMDPFIDSTHMKL